MDWLFDVYFIFFLVFIFFLILALISRESEVALSFGRIRTRN